MSRVARQIAISFALVMDYINPGSAKPLRDKLCDLIAVLFEHHHVSIAPDSMIRQPYKVILNSCHSQKPGSAMVVGSMVRSLLRAFPAESRALRMLPGFSISAPLIAPYCTAHTEVCNSEAANLAYPQEFEASSSPGKGALEHFQVRLSCTRFAYFCYWRCLLKGVQPVNERNL
jgi:hypothetical protein